MEAKNFRRNLFIQAAPLSVNAMFYNNKAHGKRKEAKDWECNIMHQLWEASNRKALQELRDYFNPKKHVYAVSLTFVYPWDKFYTKADALSSHTQDLSNCEKALIDVVFTPRYFGLNHPYQCENLNIDDKYITALVSKKLPGDSQYIKISIAILNRIRRPR